MNVTGINVEWIVGGAVSMTTGIFWGAYFIGKITSRIERLEVSVSELAKNSELLRGMVAELQMRRVRHDD